MLDDFLIFLYGAFVVAVVGRRARRFVCASCLHTHTHIRTHKYTHAHAHIRTHARKRTPNAISHVIRFAIFLGPMVGWRSFRH